MDNVTAIVIVLCVLAISTTMSIGYVVEYRSKQRLILLIISLTESHRTETDRLLDRIQAKSFTELKHTDAVIEKIKRTPVETDIYEPA